MSDTATTPDRGVISSFRRPNLRSLAAAAAEFWVAWLCLLAGMELLSGGEGPEFLFIYLLGLDALALVVERFLVLGGDMGLQDSSGRLPFWRTGIGSLKLVGMTMLMSVWLSVALMTLLVLMLFNPRDAMLVIFLVGRRIWWGWSNRPRNEEERAHCRAWWQLERRVQWTAFGVATLVGVLGHWAALWEPDAPQGGAIPLFGLAAYFAALGIFVLFRRLSTEGREFGSGYVSIAPVRTIMPFKLLSVWTQFLRNYLSLLPGILLAIATSLIILAAQPEEMRPLAWPLAYALGGLVFVAGAVRALGLVDAPLLRFALMHGRDMLFRVVGLWFLALLLLPLAVWVALVLSGWQSEGKGYPEHAVLLLPFILALASFPLLRLWPGLFTSFIYRGSRQHFLGSMRHLTPGFGTAWRMTQGFAAWRHATIPLLAVALILNGPLVWLADEYQNSGIRMLVWMLLYLVTVPFTLFVAVERAVALRLEELEGIEIPENEG